MPSYCTIRNYVIGMKFFAMSASLGHIYVEHRPGVLMYETAPVHSLSISFSLSLSLNLSHSISVK